MIFFWVPNFLQDIDYLKILDPRQKEVFWIICKKNQKIKICPSLYQYKDFIEKYLKYLFILNKVSFIQSYTQITILFDIRNKKRFLNLIIFIFDNDLKYVLVPNFSLFSLIKDAFNIQKGSNSFICNWDSVFCLELNNIDKGGLCEAKVKYSPDCLQDKLFIYNIFEKMEDLDKKYGYIEPIFYTNSRSTAICKIINYFLKFADFNRDIIIGHNKKSFLDNLNFLNFRSNVHILIEALQAISYGQSISNYYVADKKNLEQITLRFQVIEKNINGIKSYDIKDLTGVTALVISISSLYFSMRSNIALILQNSILLPIYDFIIFLLIILFPIPLLSSFLVETFSIFNNTPLRMRNYYARLKFWYYSKVIL